MRFATVVEKAGQPDVHLMLIAPEKDSALQKAIKTNRVMMVHQPGSGTDYGTVGFEKAAKGQILVFPKSLKSFEGSRIVGVKYDLLDSTSVPKGQSHQEPKKMKALVKRTSKSKSPPKPAPPLADKVVVFRKPEPEPDEEEAEEVTDLKRDIRHAMDLLEAGKQVAAFNVLKRLVE